MLSFATPWLLAAAAALPALYLLLRLAPPPPRVVKLPSIKLLGPLEETPPSAQRPPWWLVVFRLGAVSLILAGLAGPQWQPQAAQTAPARVAMVVDNGWAAAGAWPRIQEEARRQLDRLPETTRVAVLPTAAPPGGWPAREQPAPRFVDLDTARAVVAGLRPQPWPGDRARAAALLPATATLLWIADGVEDADASALRQAGSGGHVAVVGPMAPLIAAAGRSADGWAAQLVRPPASSSGATVELVARNAGGATLAREAADFGSDAATAVRLPMDPAVRNRVARVEVRPGTGAAGVYLADAATGRPRVAIVDGERRSGAPPLERGAFYARRALEPHAEVETVDLAAAPRDPATMFLLIDAPVSAGPLSQALLTRVRRGAVAVSFAGPRIAQNGSTLAPMPLRAGARALGGVLSWQAPQRIGGTAPGTPLARMPTPHEARVARQVLGATETPGVMRWAWLADGTPLVSARREGAGLLILVHTSASPGWSSLPLSGAFEAMLRRLLPLATNPRALDTAEGPPLVLDRMLMADGSLAPAPIRARIAAADWPDTIVTPQTPPGLYRAGDTVRPLNLAGGGVIGPDFRFQPLSTKGLRAAAGPAAALDLGPWLLVAGLLLVAADALVALALAGRLPGLAAVALALAFILPPDAHAQVQAQAHVTLAYVRTGNPARDALTRDGLTALSRVLTMRTAVSSDEPVAIDPARDALGRFPLVYWPVTGPRTLSPAAIERARAYLDRGGLILFDFVSGNAGGRAARAVLGPLGLPPLEELGRAHVLSRSFYLLERFPGAQGAPPVWVEANTRGDNGRVAGTIMGSADWAAAWSNDSALPYTTRELAWRWGVNVVMYALTGTYKADQVHTQALLERMERSP